MSEKEKAVLAAVAIGLSLLVVGMVEATGSLAGVLAGDRPETVGAGEAVRVAFAWSTHLGDPRQAWPAADRSALPGRW